MRHLLLSSLLVLTGCGSVVLSTVAQLNDLDPLTADPAGFAVAVDLPDGLENKPGDTSLTVQATRSSTGVELGRAYALEKSVLTDGRIVFTLPPHEADALRAMQQEAATWPRDGSNTLAMNASFGACRTENVPVTGDPRFSVWLRLAQDAPLMPLVRNAPLSEVTDPATLELCDAEG